MIRIKKKSWNQDPWIVNKIVNKEKQFRRENEKRERNAISTWRNHRSRSTISYKSRVAIFISPHIRKGNEILLDVGDR